MNKTLALALLVAAPLFPQEHSHSEKRFSIEFTNVVDSNSEFNSFGTFPAINNHGEVTFRAVRNGTTQGIFKARDEKVTTIASTADGLTLFGDDVCINPAGLVAFDANTPANSRAIMTGDGTSRTLIVDSAAAGFARIGVGSPSINADGTVAFFAVSQQPGFPQGIFTGNGGPLTTIATSTATNFEFFSNAAINEAGTVVFRAQLRDGSSGVFTTTLPAPLIDTTTHPEIDSFGDPVINNAGTIADVAFLRSSNAPLIFTANRRGVTPRNDPANPAFTNSEHPSINNQGAVAFSVLRFFPAFTDPAGIFLEVSGGPSLITVIKPGDKLFGSTVDSVNLGRFALNDRFQMAISYTLTDGRSGIAIAWFNGEREDRP